jgi:heat shock protein HtpX
MVDRLAARAGCPKPGVYVTPDPQANAFACGRNPKHAAIAVTQGIQDQLSARELEGVVAHEMAHIKNRDILIASVAAMAAGAIAAVANWLQFSLIFGGGDEEGEGGADRAGQASSGWRWGARPDLRPPRAYAAPGRARPRRRRRGPAT